VNRIAAVAVRPYVLPLVRPWRMGRAVIAERRGWLIRLACDDGRVGWGDCPAPLPDQGRVDLGDLLDALGRACLGARPEAALGGWADGNAVEAALECALLDLAAQRVGIPLARRLNAQAGERVAVNAVAPIEGVEDAAARGFRVVKIKLGAADPLAEAEAIARLVVPAGVRLRLDANRAWSEAVTAAVLERLAGQAVDSLEEPLAVPDLAAYARLQATTPIDLALDESLGDLGIETVITARAVRRLVLKPAWGGGLRLSLAHARVARGAGMRVVVTSALDSAVGVAAAAHLAAAIDPAGEMAHGLATGLWLARDVCRGLAVTHGTLCLRGPGLGIDPDRCMA